MSNAVAVYSVDDKEPVAKGQAAILLQQIESLKVIENDQQFEQAGEYLKQCAKARSIIEAETAEPKDASYKAWKSICDTVKRWVAPVELAEKHWRNIRADYSRRIEEENRKAREEALRKQREAEEAQRKLHEKEIKKAEKKGIEPPPAPVAAPIVEAPIIREVPKVPGVAQRENWKAELVDFDALIKAAIENPQAYRKYILWNEKLCNAEAKQQKEKFNVSGVKAVKNFSDQVRP